MSNTVETLLEIIDDPNLFTRRKIEAAEAILGFESPDDAIIRAREYLVSVFEDRDADIGERMDALKIARKSESAKVTPKIVRLEVKDRGERERREAWRHYEKTQLKTKIYQATGNTPTQDSHPGWSDHLTGDDYVPPPGDEWPVWPKK